MTQKKWFWYGITTLLVVAFVATIYAASQQAAPVPTSDGTALPQGSMLRIGENAIYVAEQPPGSNVNVSVATIGAPGYVVIHEVEQNDKPGAIIGASALLTSGEHTDIVIKTSQPLTNDQSYIAMLHADNGNGVFDDESTDIDVIENGAPVWMIFQTVTGASGSSLINL